MTQVEKLEQTVEQLSPDELATFRSWFIEFDAAEWDRQIEIDSEAGKLDRLAQSAGIATRDCRNTFKSSPMRILPF